MITSVSWPNIWDVDHEAWQGLRARGGRSYLQSSIVNLEGARGLQRVLMRDRSLAPTPAPSSPGERIPAILRAAPVLTWLASETPEPQPHKRAEFCMHGRRRGEVTDDGLLHPPAELVHAVPARWGNRPALPTQAT